MDTVQDTTRFEDHTKTDKPERLELHITLRANNAPEVLTTISLPQATLQQASQYINALVSRWSSDATPAALELDIGSEENLPGYCKLFDLISRSERVSSASIALEILAASLYFACDEITHDCLDVLENSLSWDCPPELVRATLESLELDSAAKARILGRLPPENEKLGPVMKGLIRGLLRSATSSSGPPLLRSQVLLKSTFETLSESPESQETIVNAALKEELDDSLAILNKANLGSKTPQIEAAKRLCYVKDRLLACAGQTWVERWSQSGVAAGYLKGSEGDTKLRSALLRITFSLFQWVAEGKGRVSEETRWRLVTIWLPALGDCSDDEGATISFEKLQEHVEKVVLSLSFEHRSEMLQGWWKSSEPKRWPDLMGCYKEWCRGVVEAFEK